MWTTNIATTTTPTAFWNCLFRKKAAPTIPEAPPPVDWGIQLQTRGKN